MVPFLILLNLLQKHKSCELKLTYLNEYQNLSASFIFYFLYLQLLKLGRILVSRRSIMHSGGLVGEVLCLKLLQHFSSHLNETCYTLWWVYVHVIIFVSPGQRVPVLCPFFQNSFISMYSQQYFVWQSGG